MKGEENAMSSDKDDIKIRILYLRKKTRTGEVCAIAIIMVPGCLCVTGLVEVRWAGISRGVYLLCTV